MHVEEQIEGEGALGQGLRSNREATQQVSAAKKNKKTGISRIQDPDKSLLANSRWNDIVPNSQLNVKPPLMMHGSSTDESHFC